MARCCVRRPEDGVVDRVAIERAVAGQPAALTPTEIRIVIGRLRGGSRRFSLDQISRHLNYSRSRISVIMQEQRKEGGS